MLVPIMEKINPCNINEGVIVKTEEVNEESHQAQFPSSRFLSLSVSPKPLDNLIRLGQTFQSFAEVSKAITVYEKRNKVHLTQKYFRRIAANPKPSNKEDYMLTKEERKRFVYRWVDFCCTYFDDMLSRTDQDDRDGNEASHVLGYAMKECPMRIRFQLRFNEKDLMISIFKEAHDHRHPNNEVPEISSLTKNTNIDTSNDTTAATAFGVLRNVKRVRPPPPSLAPISKFPRDAPSVMHSESLDSESHLHEQSSLASLNRHPEMRIQQPMLSIPKPPPLKAMPLLSSNAETPNLHPNNGCVQVPSAADIIKNIYQYLCQMATGYNRENGLLFTSSNPDLVKITSDLTGVDPARILQLCKLKRPNSSKKQRVNEDSQTHLATNAIMEASYSCKPNTVTKMKNSMQRTKNTCSMPNTNLSDITMPSVNSESLLYDQMNESTDDRFMSLPVEVIIKSEPGDSLEYYDENDSNSNSSMTMNDHYFRTESNKTQR